MIDSGLVATVAIWGMVAFNFMALVVWWRTLSRSKGVMPLLKQDVQSLDFRSMRAKQAELVAKWQADIHKVLEATSKKYASQVWKYAGLSLMIWAVCLAGTAAVTTYCDNKQADWHFLLNIGPAISDLCRQTVDNVLCGALTALSSSQQSPRHMFSLRIMSLSFTAETTFTIGCVIGQVLNWEKFATLKNSNPEGLVFRARFEDRPSSIEDFDMPQMLVRERNRSGLSFNSTEES